MDTLYNQTNKLIQQTQQSFQVLEGNVQNAIEIETDIQEKINQINSNCEKLDLFSFKLPLDQRQNAKMRCDQLKYDSRHLQAALAASKQRRSRREAAANEREQLLNRRFAPNPDLTAINIDYAIQHQNSLQNANKGVDEMLHAGVNALESLRSQRITLKGAHRRIMDMANTLGLSKYTMRLIEKRASEDKEATEALQSILPENLYRAIPEIIIYLVEGFGNSTRIDYGTGHELSFITFLCSLFKIGYLKEPDQPATACKIFVRYLEVVRKLQITYRMEPAGSHGVWSLDDYQFVPFIWGSSQFFGNPKFEPTCFLKEDILNTYADDYMFLSCIKYINEVKSGPFAEHSNQLWSISGVSNWSKINSGLIKMYKVEVLGKFPLVQHIVFGSLFSLKPAEYGTSIRRPRLSGIAAPQLGSESAFKVPSQHSTTSTSRSERSEEGM